MVTLVLSQKYNPKLYRFEVFSSGIPTKPW